MKYLPFLLVCLLVVSQPAGAWGRKGHTAIADIAEANLTPAAHKQVQWLLKNDLDNQGKPSGRTTLASIAIWSDEIRATAPAYAYQGWHTHDNAVCQAKLGACQHEECVDQKLLHYATVLKNTHATHRERNEALKWVVHLVADLHAPLHSGSNRDGAGQVPATLEGGQAYLDSTLHTMWDHDLPDAALENSPVTAVLKNRKKLPHDAVLHWMEETRQVSRKHVYEPLPGFKCGASLIGPVLLNRAYQQQAMPVIRLQIKRAGLRLAQLLNEILK
jgi:hypothetical protein